MESSKTVLHMENVTDSMYDMDKEYMGVIEWKKNGKMLMGMKIT